MDCSVGSHETDDQTPTTARPQFSFGGIARGAKNVKDVVDRNVMNCGDRVCGMNGHCAIRSGAKQCVDLVNHLKLERNHSIKRSVQFHEEPSGVVPNGVIALEDLSIANEVPSPVNNLLVTRGSLTSTPSQCGTCFSDEDDTDDESSLEEQFSERQPPDGGWGWVVVVAAFVTNLIADGVTFTFGIIYVDLLRYFGEGKSKTAWIGGLFMSMPLLSGPIASYLTDRFGCRRVCMFGSVLSAFGFVISSYAESIELLIFTFGIVSGFGLALCYVTAVVIVAYYFEKRRSLATGLSVCGSGIGTFLFAPLTTFLVTEYGWRGTTLILAGLFLNMAVCGALMRDLEWTKEKSKALRRDRLQKNRDKRKNRAHNQSLKTAVSSPASSTQKDQPQRFHDAAEFKRLLQMGEVPGCMLGDAPGRKTETSRSGTEEAKRQCSSVLNLPTFVCNGEKVPFEVLERLTSNQLYPSLLAGSRSFSDSGRLHENKHFATNHTAPPSPLVVIPHPSIRRESCIGYHDRKADKELPKNATTEEAYLWWLRKIQDCHHCHYHHSSRRNSASHVRDLKFPRNSLTYRGAMLNLKRHRQRASSCPNIYRNPTNTTSSSEVEWFAGFYDIWDLMVDMVDVSHFADIRFVLFAVSNFLLYSWYHVPYMFLADKAGEMGFSEDESSHIISYLGIFNTVGEVVLGWAGDQPRLNASMIYALCMAVCGMMTAIMPFLASYTGLCIVAGGFGLSIAANYSMASIILVELITLERFTNAYGLLLLIQGLANLVGPPLAGWLYDTSGKYDLSFYLAGFFIILCGALLMVLPAMRWTKQWTEANTQIFSTTSLKRNGLPQQNNLICEEDGDIKPTSLLSGCSEERNPM